MSTLVVAAAQAEAVAGDLVGNARTAAGLVRDAAEQGAQVVVLPEAFLNGYDFDAFAGPLPGLIDLPLDPLRDAARETGTVVVVGSALAAGGVATLSSVVEKTTFGSARQISANSRSSAPSVESRSAVSQ